MVSIRHAALAVPAALLAAGLQQGPLFHATTDHITTEVIVRNGRGVFVPDLTMSEFVVFEDGVRQTVSTFVKIIGGQAVTEVPPPVKTEGLILPPAKGPEPGRVFVVFIDDMHIQPSDTIATRRILQQIRDVLLHDGDLVAFVSTGYSSIQGTPSYDIGHARFDQLIKKVMGSGMTPAEIIAANQTSEGPAGLRHNAHVAFQTAYDTIRELAKIQNRRKAFIYVTGGYDFNPYVNARFKAVQDSYASSSGDTNGLSAADINRFRNPFDSGSQQFSEMALIAELAALAREAVLANVSFQMVDPRGLTAGPPINSNLGIEEYRAQVTTSTSSMRILAEATGGLCICERNDIASGLRSIDDAMSDYYLIGYSSTNSDTSKIRRRIEVRVSRPNVTVSGYRREYMIKR